MAMPSPALTSPRRVGQSRTANDTFDDEGRLVEEYVRTDYRSFLRQLGAAGT